MARHNTFTLDSETAAHAERMRDVLKTADSAGRGVSFSVQGRDSGTVTYRTGTVIGFSGDYGMSTETVLVDTDKGPRSFNVWLIRSIQIGE